MAESLAPQPNTAWGETVNPLPLVAAAIVWVVLEGVPLGLRLGLCVAVAATLPAVRRGSSWPAYAGGVVAILLALLGPAQANVGPVPRLHLWFAFFGVVATVLFLVRRLITRQATLDRLRSSMAREAWTARMSEVPSLDVGGRRIDLVLTVLTPIAGGFLVWQLMGGEPTAVRAGIVAAFVLILASGLARHPLWVLYGAGIVAGLLPLSPQALSTLPGEALVHQWLTFAGIVAVVAYLTSRLREQEAALSEITDRKERFVALAHHELRTPVTVLTSALDTLMEDLDGVLSPEQRHFLEAAQLNTDRLRHQVEMLTRYAELKDVAAADVEVAPLGETIDRVAAELAPYFAGRGVGLVQEVDPKAAWVSFPGPHVETILRQLLRNSATFNAPEGSVRLSVTCRRSSVVIEVEDDGWGIEPESRAAIFESFYQPGDLLTRQREGLGFGLALVNLAVERLDGAVDVTSASGQGSCFIVRLPMRPWITTGDTSASSEPPADHRVGARTA